MPPRFVSEPIKPVPGSMEPGAMSRGEPGLPRKFVWRDTEYTVSEVVRQWRETGPCSSGGGEQYARKHWFHVRTSTGEEMKLYFERQARSPKQKKARWWLHSVLGEEGAE